MDLYVIERIIFAYAGVVGLPDLGVNGARLVLQNHIFIGLPVTDNKVGSDMKNMITAYGVSELQKVVEKMANGIPLAYMGIRGVDVPREANQELGVPYGAYVLCSSETPYAVIIFFISEPTLLSVIIPSTCPCRSNSTPPAF